MDKATKKHFFTHGKDPDIEERANCHWCQLRSFPTHNSIPITVVNDVDDQVLPNDFGFINSMAFGDGVEPTEDSFRSGCSCTADDSCQFTACTCLADLADEEYNEGQIIRGEGLRKAYAYHTHGAKAGLLRSKLLNSTLPLYECHQGCSCSNACPNRVVERGRTVPLQIFRTEDRGWGVRAQAFIRRGQFVDRYLGEIISCEEADRRRASSAVSRRKDVYLFALDKFTDPDSLDPRLKGPPLEVDGEFMSGPTRFINHSCDPNLRIFARVGDHADKHIHDLALFAIRDILQGEELTFDYVDGVTDDFDEVDGNVDDFLASLFAHPMTPKQDKHDNPLHRLNRQRASRYESQIASGRPSRTDKLCENSGCCRVCCTYEEASVVLMIRETNQLGVPTDTIYSEFLTTTTRLMWPTRDRVYMLFTKYHLAESFIKSPPVHVAYLMFSKLSKDASFGTISEGQLRGSILSVLPDFEKAMFDRSGSGDVHQYLDIATGTSVRARLDLSDFVLRYLVSIELWRRREVSMGRDWKFEDDKCTCAFLASTLLQLWTMDQEGCFETETDDTIKSGWYTVWDKWLGRYPRMELGDDLDKAVFAQKQFGLPDEIVASQVGYIGGVGRCLPGWLHDR